MKRKLSSPPPFRKTLKTTALKLVSWNVNGLRAALRKGSIQSLLALYQPNILCIQESKLQTQHIEQVQTDLDSRYHMYWNCCTGRKGTAGVALITDKAPIRLTYDLDQSGTGVEGRILTAEFETYILINVYFPQPGNDFMKLPEKLAWEGRFKGLVKTLQEGKPVVCLGDFNIVLGDKDCPEKHLSKLHRYFHTTEISSFRNTVQELQLIDSYRHFHPEATKYTYYSARDKQAKEKGNGWRLDYIFASVELLPKLVSSDIIESAIGSDHLPVLVQMCI